MQNRPSIEALLETIKALRDPQTGCPWDLKQSHQSLLPFLLEEAYEFREAVINKDFHHMEEEIGDVLLQVLLHAQIASETQAFTWDSVCQKLNEKLIRRHPHVFGEAASSISIEEVKENWKKIKEREKSASKQSLLPAKLAIRPSLLAAEKIGEATQKIGFDWETAQQVLAKVNEELQEVKTEIETDQSSNQAKIQEEVGDLLFTVAQLARHLNVEADQALHLANKKFLRRFHSMEELATEAGKSLDSMSLQEKENLWKQVKQAEQ